METPIKYDDEKLPERPTTDARAVYDAFFKKSRPYPIRVRQAVMQMHRQDQHKTIIACLKSAIAAGQAQPWMYEVLALSMEIEGYPKEDIERVVLSLSDFGSVSFESLIYSAAYLKRFDRNAASLRLYRQSSQLSPERHEPYVLSLPLAEKVNSTSDVIWAAEGILQHYWGDDYKQKHRRAEDAIFNLLRKLRSAGKDNEMMQLASRLKQAKGRDVSVRVEWSGQGDLDLQVEEPPGSVCSFETPLTYAGGIFLHDGTGPIQAECYESYVCPTAVSGTYRVRVKNAFGKVVGNRAVVTVLLHAGRPEEEKIVRTIVLDDGEGSFTFELQNGRRTQPRQLTMLRQQDELRIVDVQPQQARNSRRFSQRQSEVLQQFSTERLGTVPGRAGAVGVSPVVQTIPDGSSLSAQAVVSPDRRYVRLSMRPTFTTVTDVFTFSFLNRSTQNNGGN